MAFVVARIISRNYKSNVLCGNMILCILRYFLCVSQCTIGACLFVREMVTS